MISEISYQNFKGIKIENHMVSLVTIPDIGGKIVSIKDKKNNFEYVYNEGFRDLKKSEYDSSFDMESPTGIDECFPTIGKCIYPDFPWKGINIPDHGEIWPLKFKNKIKGTSSVYQEVNGIRFPYLFTREIKLLNNRIIFFYRIKNLCNMDFKFGWSMHPQFVIMEDTIIEIVGNPDFYVDFSTKYNFGVGTKKFKWPCGVNDKDGKIDFSILTDINDGNLTKLYLLNISGKKVDLFYKNVQQRIGVEFYNEERNFYGIAINKGGWPFNGKPYNWIGIEACNCITDKLSESIKRGVFGLLKQNSTVSWEVIFIIN